MTLSISGEGTTPDEQGALPHSQQQERSPFMRILLPLLTINALVLLSLAHLPFQDQRFTTLSGLGLLLGLGLWLVVLLKSAPAADVLGELSMLGRIDLRRAGLLVLALISAGLAWLRTGGKFYELSNVVPWLAAVAFWLAAWWPVERSSDTPVPDAERRRRLITAGLLALITLVGIFFRFYRLDQTPYEPTSDHAEKLLDVNDLVEGQRPLFFERNTGREPLQFYLTFWLIKLFGLPTSFETLKAGTALVDTLAIPAVYLFAKELGGRRVGLLAAALYSFAQWPVTIARVGLRFPYGPLPTALTLWALARYMRRGDRRDMLLCGLIIGVGLHGYSPFRVVALLVPLFLGLMLLFDRRWRGRRLTLIGHGLLAGATAALVFLPLIHFMVASPEHFWERAASRTLGEYDQRAGDSVGEALANNLDIFLRNNRNALLAFNWKGDTTQVNFLPLAPFLDPLTAAALLMGLLVVLYRIVVRRSPRYAALVLAIPVLLLASTLSLAWPDENPSINRMGPVAPIIFTFAALPLAMLVRQLELLRARARLLLPALACALFLLIAGRDNYQRFFVEFHEFYASHSLGLPTVLQALRSDTRGVDMQHTYHVPFPHWLDSRNIGIGMGDFTWGDRNVMLDDVPLAPPADGMPLLFVLHRDDLQHQAQLQQRWPAGELRLVPVPYEHQTFATFYVPAGAQQNINLLTTTPLDLEGQPIEIGHSQLDMGNLPDLFDANPETLIRGAYANPFTLELRFTQERPLQGLDLTVALTDFRLQVVALGADGAELARLSEEHTGLSDDPTVAVMLAETALPVWTLRLEITDLTFPPDPHVHVRELTLR